ncbi:MAG TPA: putative nucleotidyltransferase substrate binding domain-containing protein, partial [Armatimonadota bacterium]|nr:putative nucleotidyltransferase substrate binding domain-containing protein [Armatimonadota bacterium]
DIRARSLVLLAGDPTQHDLEALAEYGVKDAQRCARALRHLAHGSVTAPLPPSVAEQFADLAPSVLQAAARTPDPDASIANFGEFCGLIGSYGALYSLLADEPQVVEMLVRVAGCSASLSAILARHPEYFDMLMDPGLMEAVRSREKVTGELGVRLDDVSDSALRIQTVSRFRRRELLRVGVRDLMNGADTETTINELSVIAEACLEGLLDTVSLDAAGATGRELPFAVMGMGKLAGGELHYNSDLDVMFVWGEGGDAGPDSQRLFTRVASGVLAAAGAAAPGEGPPLTIDARLRPEGQNGPLVRSVSACAEYYANRASTWERMALIRCRAVAGSDVVGRAFVDSVAPFVWRDGLRPEELAEIIHMKGRIEQERANTADGKVDVKLGPGGIGDIEFGAQLLQLAHGHETASIRADGTLSGIRALTSAGLLESTEAESIESAYLFLRRVECRLQIVHAWDESTIEPGSGGFEALARLLEYREDGGRSAAECLAADLDAHRRASRSFWEGTVARLGG